MPKTRPSGPHPERKSQSLCEMPLEFPETAPLDDSRSPTRRQPTRCISPRTPTPYASNDEVRARNRHARRRRGADPSAARWLRIHAGSRRRRNLRKRASALFICSVFTCGVIPPSHLYAPRFSLCRVARRRHRRRRADRRARGEHGLQVPAAVPGAAVPDDDGAGLRHAAGARRPVWLPDWLPYLPGHGRGHGRWRTRVHHLRRVSARPHAT